MRFGVIKTLVENKLVKSFVDNKLDKNMLPEWFDITDDKEPSLKEKIIKIYGKTHE